MLEIGPDPPTAHRPSREKGLRLPFLVTTTEKEATPNGGRTKIKDTAIAGMTRMEYGAHNTTDSFAIETREILQWKAAHTNSAGTAKNTLRLEMVGPYTYMFKVAVRNRFIDPILKHDLLLMHYLRLAVSNDNPQKYRF